MLQLLSSAFLSPHKRRGQGTKKQDDITSPCSKHIKLSIREKLCPVQHTSALVTADTDFPERSGKYILSVPLGIHPAVHNLFGRRIAVGDIFPRRAVGNAELLSGGKAGASVRSGMGEVFYDLLCAQTRDLSHAVVLYKRRKPVVYPFGVNQPEHLRFIGSVECGVCLCRSDSLRGLFNRLRGSSLLFHSSRLPNTAIPVGTKSADGFYNIIKIAIFTSILF